MPNEKLDFSQTYIVEGTVEQDPMTDRFTIHTHDQRTGRSISFDPEGALAMFKGQEVRLVLAPLAHIAEIERLVAKQQESGEEAFVVDPLLPKNGGGEA